VKRCTAVIVPVCDAIETGQAAAEVDRAFARRSRTRAGGRLTDKELAALSIVHHGAAQLKALRMTFKLFTVRGGWDLRRNAGVVVGG